MFRRMLIYTKFLGPSTFLINDRPLIDNGGRIGTYYENRCKSKFLLIYLYFESFLQTPVFDSQPPFNSCLPWPLHSPVVAFLHFQFSSTWTHFYIILKGDCSFKNQILSLVLSYKLPWLKWVHVFYFYLIILC